MSLTIPKGIVNERPRLATNGLVSCNACISKTMVSPSQIRLVGDTRCQQSKAVLQFNVTAVSRAARVTAVSRAALALQRQEHSKVSKRFLQRLSRLSFWSDLCSATTKYWGYASQLCQRCLRPENVTEIAADGGIHDEDAPDAKRGPLKVLQAKNMQHLEWCTRMKVQWLCEVPSKWLARLSAGLWRANGFSLDGGDLVIEGTKTQKELWRSWARSPQSSL